MLYIVKVFLNFKESTRYLKVWIAKYVIKLQKKVYQEDINQQPASVENLNQ